MDNETLRVRVHVNEDDLRAFLKRAFQRSGTRTSWPSYLLTYLVVLPGLPLVPWLSMSSPVPPPPWLLSALLLAFGIWAIFFVRSKLAQARTDWVRSLEAQRQLQRTDVEIDADGMRATAPLSSASFAWSLVSGIEHDGERSFIWLGRADAQVIPDRAFPDANAREAFMQRAEALRSAYRGGAVLCPGCSEKLYATVTTGCPVCGWGRDETGTTG